MKKLQGLLGLVIALVLTGCATDKVQEPMLPVQQEAKKVILYASRSEPVVEFVAEKFRKAYPDYELEVHWVGGGDALDELTQDKKNVQGDIWWGANQAELQGAVREGLLRPIPEDIQALVPDIYQERKGRWMADSLFPTVFVTHKETLAEKIPRKWEFLVHRDYENQFYFLVPEQDLTFPLWLGAIMYRKGYFQEEDGLQWLRKLDANTAQYVDTTSDLMRKILEEPGRITWMSLPEALKMREYEKLPIQIRAPLDSQPVEISGVGLLDGAPHPRGGELFLRFLYSDPMQAELMKKFYQVSARQVIPESLRPAWYAEWTIRPMDLDWEWTAGNERKNLVLWEERVRGQGYWPKPKVVVVPTSSK